MRGLKIPGAILIAIILLIQGHFVFGALKDDIASMNDEILNKKKQIQDLTAKINEYQKKIDQEETKTKTLARSIEITKNKIAQIELNINRINLNIDTSNLEIKALESTIGFKQDEIDKQKTNLGGLVKSLDRLDREGPLRLLVLNASFSALFNQIKYLESVQSGLLGEMRTLKAQRDDLAGKNKELTIKKNLLVDQKQQLEEQTMLLNEKRKASSILMKASISKQSQLKDIIDELTNEKNQVNNDIANISSAIKEKIRNSDQYKIGENVILSWPVDPKKGLSTVFHDPEYPFRYVYEHPGIDIRTPQGTPVKAAAPGYVVTARDGGYGYSYIILIHFDGSYTVYGHVSRIDVKKDALVARGDIIGLSGGTPGTRGAGKLTTGPHLHFEVHNKNNTPVNPLNYLVSIY